MRDGGGLESFWEFFRTKYLSGHRVIRNSEEKKSRGIDGAVTYVDPDFDDGKFKYRTLMFDGGILQTRQKLDDSWKNHKKVKVKSHAFTYFLIYTRWLYKHAG
eukprot:GHVS01017337.1.p2 GENE.GHVS01017337.1~~GHVS01017337.1.p2  ORF type:complete len:103 (-),score=9.96 GHVS01017337.1:255-563(-)